MTEHIPFFHSIIPPEGSETSLLYFEDSNKQHYGGLFNSFYPHDIKTLIGTENLSLQGHFPTQSQLKIWLHSVNEPSKILHTIAVEGAKTISIPSFDILPGHRLTLELEASLTSDDPHYFSWGISEPKQPPHLVNLAVVVCTYNNEDLVVNNIKKLTKNPIWDSLPADLIVVNNGGSDSPLELPYSRVTQYKQKNSGGSGGFYRGIEEAFLKDKNYTHVLLMDDDIEFHPEVIHRTIKFHQYSKIDAVLGASMLKLEDRTFLHEAGAKYRKKHSIGSFSPVKPGLITPTKISELGTTQPVHYNGWWYCSFSRNAVKAVGMPLKIFIHSDDEEYALRLRHHGFPSYCLGGLSIWHASFENKHPTWIRYFDFRNNLIRLLTQKGEMKNSPCVAPMQLKRVVKRALIRNDYGAAIMATYAYKDLSKNNFSWEIECYDTKISELKSLYAEFMSKDATVSGRYRFHGKSAPRRWWKRPIAWVRYITTNLTFLPLDSLRCYVTTTPNYSWWDVPFLADIIVQTNDGSIEYPRCPILMHRVKSELNDCLENHTISMT